MSQLISEESRLQEMRGGECSAYAVTNSGGPTSDESGQPTPSANNAKKPLVKSKDNLWCNYCEKKDMQRKHVGNYMEDLLSYIW